MSNTNYGSQVDVKQLESLLARHASQGASIPRGTYSGRVVQVRQQTDTWGRPVTRAVLTVSGGSHGGKQISVEGRGVTAKLLEKAACSGKSVAFDVFVRRRDDGREFSQVNRETIRWASSMPAEPVRGLPAHVRKMMQTAEQDVGDASRRPTKQEIAAAAAAYPYGFACIGSKEAKRQIVPWAAAYESMAGCTTDFVGEPVLLSTFNFCDRLKQYVNNNDKPGSMAGYRGPAYSPLLVFDIDRKDALGRPSPADALQDVSALIVVLMELGFPHECISIFYSGSKGFHVAAPSSLCGAMPSEKFPAIAREFCSLIAAEAGIEIDLNLYRTLQPLRAPNSRHEVSGLFKIVMKVEEFLKLSLSEIQLMATRPRLFVPPPLVHEPIPVLSELWSHAERMTGDDQAFRSECASGTVEGQARIFQSTWEFLIRGAPDGERAVALFRAAANLADFDSLDGLIQSLLSRGATLCGLPPTEATAHIESALRRAAECQLGEPIKPKS